MKTASSLSGHLAELLRSGVAAVLITVGEDGWGHAAMTWAAAAAPDRVRFVADLGSATLANLERDGRASLQVIGPDNVLALIKGRVRERRARIAASPFGMAMWEMAIAEVRDQAWSPVAVSPLAYRWVGPEAETLSRMEQAVLAELRDPSD